MSIAGPPSMVAKFVGTSTEDRGTSGHEETPTSFSKGTTARRTRTLALVLLALASRFITAAEPVATVELFMAIDCPIANGYAPEIERLHLTYREKGLVFRLVFPDRDLDENTVKQHLADYGITAPFVIDRDHALVKRTAATTIPEVVLYDRTGGIVYQGKLDNRYSDLGDRRGTVTEFYLRDAIEAVLSGKQPPVARTAPIGCLIETGI